MNPLHYTVKGPAFNYMVPTPHSYIMGDRVGYGATSTAIAGAFLKKAIKKFSPITSPTQLQDLVSATQFAIEQERSAKNLTTYTDEVADKTDDLYVEAGQALTKEKVQAVLGGLRTLARDSEAPLTRTALGLVQIGDVGGEPADRPMLQQYLMWGTIGIVSLGALYGIIQVIKKGKS